MIRRSTYLSNVIFKISPQERNEFKTKNLKASTNSFLPQFFSEQIKIHSNKITFHAFTHFSPIDIYSLQKVYYL